MKAMANHRPASFAYSPAAPNEIPSSVGDWIVAISMRVMRAWAGAEAKAETATLMCCAVRLNRSRRSDTIHSTFRFLVRDSRSSRGWAYPKELFAEKVQKRFIESLRRFEMRQMTDAIESYDFRIRHARR
jgi:hypothetical protein